MSAEQFQVGDWVLVERRVNNYSEGWNNVWNDESMTRFIGTRQQIRSIESTGLVFHSDPSIYDYPYQFPPNGCRKLTPDEVAMSEGVFRAHLTTLPPPPPKPLIPEVRIQAWDSGFGASKVVSGYQVIYFHINLFCCGILEIGGFNLQGGKTYEPAQDAMMERVFEYGRSHRKGVIRATLISSQPEAKRLLEDHDFEMIYSFNNPNSRNTVYVYENRTFNGNINVKEKDRKAIAG